MTTDNAGPRSRARAALFVLRLLLSALCLLLPACASAPKTTAPQLKYVPANVVEALCSKLRSEGISSITSIAVVRTTQPIVNASSLRSLAHIYFVDAETSGMAQEISSALTPLKVDVAGSASCPWEPIDRFDPAAQAQSTVVEFSAPFPNPFAQGQGGVLVRMSVGGHDAQWYWVPLAEREGRLGVGNVLSMDFHE